MDHWVSFRMDLLLKKPKRICFFRLEMTVFSRMFSMAKMPVARRSSVSREKPFLMDSRGVRLRQTLPWSLMVPVLRVALPKMFSSVSVRPLPSRPARPRTSPERAWKLTSFKRLYWALRFSTSNETDPGTLVFSGNWFFSSRPTMYRMMSAFSSSSAGLVTT